MEPEAVSENTVWTRGKRAGDGAVQVLLRGGGIDAEIENAVAQALNGFDIDSGGALIVAGGSRLLKHDAAARIAGRVHVGDVGGRHIHGLSGGKQRLHGDVEVGGESHGQPLKCTEARQGVWMAAGLKDRVNECASNEWSAGEGDRRRG